MNRKDSARLRIVDAARALFTAEGYQATSTEMLLRTLDISRGALYHHFPSKEALFAAVLDAVETEVAGAVIDAARKASEPQAMLTAGFDAFLALAATPEVRQVVLIDAPAVVGWQHWRRIEEQHALGAIKQALLLAATQRLLPREMVDTAAHLMLASLVELALLVANDADPARTLKTGKKTVRRLLKGLLSPAVV